MQRRQDQAWRIACPQVEACMTGSPINPAKAGLFFIR